MSKRGHAQSSSTKRQNPTRNLANGPNCAIAPQPINSRDAVSHTDLLTGAYCILTLDGQSFPSVSNEWSTNTQVTASGEIRTSYPSNGFTQVSDGARRTKGARGLTAPVLPSSITGQRAGGTVPFQKAIHSSPAQSQGSAQRGWQRRERKKQWRATNNVNSDQHTFPGPVWPLVHPKAGEQASGLVHSNTQLNLTDSQPPWPMTDYVGHVPTAPCLFAQGSTMPTGFAPPIWETQQPAADGWQHAGTVSAQSQNPAFSDAMNIMGWQAPAFISPSQESPQTDLAVPDGHAYFDANLWPLSDGHSRELQTQNARGRFYPTQGTHLYSQISAEGYQDFQYPQSSTQSSKPNMSTHLPYHTRHLYQ